MRIELDTVVNENETIEGVIADFTQGTDIVGIVVMEHGPAGGNPMIAWEGPEAQLHDLVNRHYGGDAMEIAFGS